MTFKVLEQLHIVNKLDKQLFRRYTRGAKEKCITEGQFAGDVGYIIDSHK